LTVFQCFRGSIWFETFQSIESEQEISPRGSWRQWRLW